jgi:IclR family acetate operon transcriptional repressor
MTILACFEATDGHLTLAELTRRTGLPKATVHRLLLELAVWGLIERHGPGWRLGVQLFELGQLVPRQRNLHDAALPFLNDLSDATHETVHLGILDGIEIVYIEKLSRRGAPSLPSRVGGRMPLHCTGIGKVLLAYSPAALLHDVVNNGLERRTARTIVAPGLLARQLEEIRRQGFAFEREESTSGVVCIACPVLDESGQLVAGISLSGWANHLDTNRVASAVRAAAMGLSARLRELANGGRSTGIDHGRPGADQGDRKLATTSANSRGRCSGSGTPAPAMTADSQLSAADSLATSGIE